MENWTLEHELIFRMGMFTGSLLALLVAQTLAPKRTLSQPRPLRWFSNLGMSFLDQLLLRIMIPLAAVGVAGLAAGNAWGLFNLVSLPAAVEIAIAILLLDLVIYGQHVLFHRAPVLWRIHRVHHTDLDFDVTTGVRFHPVEILLSMGIKMAAVLLIGPSPVAVILFEVLLNATTQFNHANLRLPARLDRLLRLFVVTPDMHRVHHSVHRFETDSNYGFNVPWWDWLFGTYRPQPRDGHEKMVIGVRGFQNPKFLRLHWMLALPWLKQKADED